MIDFYQPSEADVRRYAQFAQAEVRERGDELHFMYCPFCNGGGHDKWTFSINLKSGQYHCLREKCGATGNLVTLHKIFGFPLNTQADEYYDRKKAKQAKVPTTKPQIMTDEVRQYLYGRGISEEVIVKYEIGNSQRYPHMISMPMYDENKKLVAIKIRDPDKNAPNKEFFEESGYKMILYGMGQCNPNNGTLVMCEGFIDALSVATAGIENALSIPTGAKGYTWFPYCWDWIHTYKEMVVFGDLENGEMTLLKDFRGRLKLVVRAVQEEDYCGCKDANEILQKYGPEQIRKCIENAKVVPTAGFVALQNVKRKDLESVIKIPTGVSKFDKMLHGGLPMGVVSIISGKAGEGKSTFASQIVSMALKNGHKCFCYSGELPNDLFKQWLDFQIAGPYTVKNTVGRFGEDIYWIPDEDLALIERWYEDRIWLYDSEMPPDENTQPLCDMIKDAIMKYGADVILIDNLMTAMSLQTIKGEDKFEKQGAFVRELAKIALTMNVCIILVAHKRKDSFGSVNDSISGSADIINLAGVNISYERTNTIDSDQRKAKLTKNRFYGSTDFNGIDLNYDPASKRIFADIDGCGWDVGWDPKSDGFHDYTEFDFDDADFPFKEGGDTN